MTEALEAQRRCIRCRKVHHKSDLLRLVCDEEGSVWPDILQKTPGRGAYVCWGECLNHLHDRHVCAAWKGGKSGTPRVDDLYRRLAVALLCLCRQYVRRGRRGVNIGRGAVMHRMWSHAPVLIVLALDAGDALKRQIREACTKREDAGLKTTCISFENSVLLGEFLERNKVSVLAMDETPANEKWWRYCMWYEQLLMMKSSLLNME